MRKKKMVQDKVPAEQAQDPEQRKRMFDRFRWHLAMTMISDIFEHHAECRFRDCREAGRCLSFDRFEGVCPIPLDNTRAMMFVAMLWFDDAMFDAEQRERIEVLKETVEQLEKEKAAGATT